jgi:hypothetical protein
MQVEEIVLSTECSDIPDEQPSADLISTAALTQTSRLRLCAAVLELFNRRHLYVSTESAFGRDREYNLDIGILDPVPKRSLKISWRHIALFLVFATCAAYTALRKSMPEAGTWSAILAVTSGIFLLIAIYKSHDRLVFYSRTGRLPLVILFNRNPDRKTFNEFADQLVHCTEQAGGRCVNENERLNAELKELRRLMALGVISRKRYELAKLRILERHH